MWWNKKKPKPLTLPAPEARVIAQLQAVRVKFEREQQLLNHVLVAAKNGKFQCIAHDHTVFSLPDSQFGWSLLIVEEDITFFKSQGYKVEKEEKTWSDNRYSPNDRNHRLTKYPVYTIKW